MLINPVNKVERNPTQTINQNMHLLQNIIPHTNSGSYILHVVDYVVRLPKTNKCVCGGHTHIVGMRTNKSLPDSMKLKQVQLCVYKVFCVWQCVHNNMFVNVWFISDFAIKIVHPSTMNNHSQSVINFKGIYVWYELSTNKWFAYCSHKTISRIRRFIKKMHSFSLATGAEYQHAYDFNTAN